MSSSAGGVMCMTFALSFIGLILMLRARPVYVHLNERFVFDSIGSIAVPICYTLILIFTAVAIFRLRWGIHSLDQRAL